MELWRVLVRLTPHELDVLRTVAVCIGSALVPVLTFLLGWGIRLLRRIRHDAEAAREQTAVGERIDGVVRSVGVAEIARDAAEHARRSVTSGEATRQEISDLGGWIRGTGRRRQATGAVPHIDGPSLYTGAIDERPDHHDPRDGEARLD